MTISLSDAARVDLAPREIIQNFAVKSYGNIER